MESPRTFLRGHFYLVTRGHYYLGLTSMRVDCVGRLSCADGTIRITKRYSGGHVSAYKIVGQWKSSADAGEAAFDLSNCMRRWPS